MGAPHSRGRPFLSSSVRPDGIPNSALRTQTRVFRGCTSAPLPMFLPPIFLPCPWLYLHSSRAAGFTHPRPQISDAHFLADLHSCSVSVVAGGESMGVLDGKGRDGLLDQVPARLTNFTTKPATESTATFACTSSTSATPLTGLARVLY